MDLDDVGFRGGDSGGICNSRLEKSLSAQNLTACSVGAEKVRIPGEMQTMTVTYLKLWKEV